MYIQWFVKGIAGTTDPDSGLGLTWDKAKQMLLDGHGIMSNWWRNKPGGLISPSEVHAILNANNLDRHVHDNENYGSQTPFISVAAGCVERDYLVSRNFVYSALTTALDFATDAWARPGAIFYGWLPVALNPAVELSAVAEEIRDLNVYQRWSPYQLEGEITAKVHIPANQIKLVEWWDGAIDRRTHVDRLKNTGFLEPKPIINVREYF